MLAGPKVARLLPYLQEKGFIAEAFQKGSEALNRMRQAPCHLLLLELECGDTMGIDLARGARQEGICGATLLVDDPMKSGMIISALARGVDAYVAIPPDETIFFSRIETMLLAQWGLVVTQQQGQLTAEIERLQKAVADADAGKVAGERRFKERSAELEKQLAAEKKKVADLEREASVLRDQLATMHLVTGAKSGLSDEGHAENVDFLIDDAPAKKPAKASTPPKAAAPAPPAPKPAPRPTPPAPAKLDLDDLDDLDGLATMQSPAPTPKPLGTFDDESTQDIPASVAATALKGVKPAKAPAPAALADFDPGGGLDDLEHLATMAVPREAALSALGGLSAKKKPAPAVVDDVHTMAMPADLARSLVESAVGKKPASVDDARTMAMSADEARALVAAAGKKPAVVDDVHTMAMSADVARALVAEASRTGPAARRPAPIAEEAPTLAGLGDLSLDHTDEFASPPLDDFDAPTAAVSLARPGQKPTGGKPAPQPIDSIFDEPTPAAGIKGPPLPRSVGMAPAKNSGFDRRPGKPPALDSQVVKDLAQMPSLDDEEVLFLEDD